MKIAHRYAATYSLPRIAVRSLSPSYENQHSHASQLSFAANSITGRPMDNREKLVQKSIEFLTAVKDMTPGAEMERWLNKEYGQTSQTYQELSRLIRLGIEEGWAANQEVDGPKYRRSRIQEPTPETFHFSITAVYMESELPQAFADEHEGDVLRGQFHGHPYGELNMVIPIDAGAELKGLQGWQGAGWTAPDPGSRHYPEVKGGALIALFYLPAGRISYDFAEPVA